MRGIPDRSGIVRRSPDQRGIVGGTSGHIVVGALLRPAIGALVVAVTAGIGIGSRSVEAPVVTALRTVMGVLVAAGTAPGM